MKRLDASEFNEVVGSCDQATRDIVAFLRTAAEHAGPLVEAPSFEVRGVGMTCWVRGRRFCRFDPKPKAGHVWVMVPGADREALRAAGDVSARDDGPWVTIQDLPSAVRLVPLMLQSYDTASSRTETATDRNQ
jgi:hypothetical protein